MQWATSLVDLS